MKRDSALSPTPDVCGDPDLLPPTPQAESDARSPPRPVTIRCGCTGALWSTGTDTRRVYVSGSGVKRYRDRCPFCRKHWYKLFRSLPVHVRDGDSGRRNPTEQPRDRRLLPYSPCGERTVDRWRAHRGASRRLTTRGPDNTGNETCRSRP